MQTISNAPSTSERVAHVIFEHAVKISKENDISALANLNADLARDLTGAERCSLWLLEPHGEMWTRVAHVMPEIRIHQGFGIVGACVAENQTIIINDAKSHPQFFSGVDDNSGYRTHSVACVPLTVDQRVIGAIQALNKEGGFSAEDGELLRLMAVYSAAAIQAERLRHDAQTAMLLQRELEIAAEVQRKLLPEAGANWPGIEVAALCRPAKSVGGDFYDLLELPGERFGLTLGDVSGKGFPAAVMMASIHTLLRNLLLHNPANLARMFEELNETIHRSSSAERYSTLFCGVLNPERSELTYVNAGHIPPFVVRSGGRIERAGETDVPVGLLPGSPYRQHSVQIAPGDLIVCVSDGIIEAQNPEGELWDSSQAEDILRNCMHLPVPEILDQLVCAVDEYAAGSEQADDITAVVLRSGGK